MYRLIEESLYDNFYGAGIVFVNHRGMILVLQKPNGFWGMPGGKPLKGESPEETAIRESEEETGLKANIQTKPITIYYNNKKYYSFIHELTDYVSEIILSKEHKKYAWVTVEELKKLKLIPPLKQNLSVYLKEIKKLLN